VQLGKGGGRTLTHAYTTTRHTAVCKLRRTATAAAALAPSPLRPTLLALTNQQYIRCVCEFLLPGGLVRGTCPTGAGRGEGRVRAAAGRAFVPPKAFLLRQGLPGWWQTAQQAHSQCMDGFQHPSCLPEPGRGNERQGRGSGRTDVVHQGGQRKGAVRRQRQATVCLQGYAHGCVKVVPCEVSQLGR
jgi:hypothetical protein